MSIGILLDTFRRMRGHVHTGGAYWTVWRGGPVMDGRPDDVLKGGSAGRSRRAGLGAFETTARWLLHARASYGTGARHVAGVRARSCFLPRSMGGPAASDARGTLSYG